MANTCISQGNSISLAHLDCFTVGQKCARFVAYLFPFATDCLLAHPASNTWSYFPRYVAYVLCRSKFDPVVVIAAMVLLQRYNEVAGMAHVLHDTDMYRLFFSSFVVASKAIRWRSYKLEFWLLVAGGIFSQEDILDMVHDFCRSLDCDIHIDANTLIRFVSILHEDAGFLGDEHVLDKPPPSYEDIHRDIKIIGSLDFNHSPHSILR